MQLNDLTTGQHLAPADYDQLTCCDRPAQVGHATETLPVAGAVCGGCLCAATSPNYGPITVNRCPQHRG